MNIIIKIRFALSLHYDGYYATRSKWDYNILHILMQSFNESDLLKRLKPKVRYQAHIENKGACNESGESVL